tara:strand:- start:98 stop:856 length:759 start_codon:yes stop_codon:yes gene_type:complete
VIDERILKEVEKMNGKLNLLTELLAEMLQAPEPKFVQVAKKTLAKTDEVVEELAPESEKEEVKVEVVESSTEEESSEDFIVGKKVLFIGDREAYKGKQGTIVEINGAWVRVVFEDSSKPVSCRKMELSQTIVEQAPVEELSTEEEIHSQMKISDMVMEENPDLLKDEVVAETPVQSTGLDEEAAAHKIPQGAYSTYRDIHAIYSDMNKRKGNRNYLRYRAKHVIKDDVTTKEMCHRYLVSVNDEEYRKDVVA